ncbi:MAG: ATP-binding protein [Deltaproteobacteria bacterium]|nr:ATP-binding protein [Deltaproteobacteria bacterium]
MRIRLIQLPKKHSIFLFGPRGSGKSTLLSQMFFKEHSYWIDLLDPEQEERFALKPSELASIVRALPNKITHVVIDEVQKNPKLLDVVHSLIESTDKIFLLTGSSARKLKRGAANLLAGRAFVYHLFPFSFLEQGSEFNLDEALRFGQLPKLEALETVSLKIKYLNSYANTYLKEEIASEQVVRKLLPFRKFLEVAAQSNGKILNYAKIAKDVGVAETTVKEYFSILEDTLLGTILEPFHHSFRKRLRQTPKFYFFDNGIARSLSRRLTLALQPKTSAYGDAFEQFIINEALKLISYFHEDYKVSYLQTKDGAEIDLVIERPGLPLLCVEIKSSDFIREEDLSSFTRLTKDLGDCEAICLCNEKTAKSYEGVAILPWQQGLKRYFVES